MFAVLKTGGKQYKVQTGDVLRVEKLAATAGETIQFNDILMVGGETLTVGSPLVAGAAVQAEVIDQIGEYADAGLDELIVPDWFYRAVLDDALILTIDRAYFDLTGGLDRWLYRLVRKHGGRQRAGWRFEFRHLHVKSGSLSPFKRFAFELRQIRSEEHTSELQSR
jgi:hypothetical protein